MSSSRMQNLELKPWQLNFYVGERLRAEVQLFGAAFVKDLSLHELRDGCGLLQASFGISNPSGGLSPFQNFQGALRANESCR